jgi:hypothetical protein
VLATFSYAERMRSRLSLLSLLLLSLSLAGLVSCSSSDDADTSGGGIITKSVGPDGATIEVGGATVTIPKGALTRSIDITISASDQGAPEGFTTLSKIFKCGPSGIDFAQGVTMKMPFNDDGQGPSSLFWSSGDDPTFKDLGGKAEGGAMTATVMHFSSGFVGRKKP